MPRALRASGCCGAIANTCSARSSTSRQRAASVASCNCLSNSARRSRLPSSSVRKRSSGSALTGQQPPHALRPVPALAPIRRGWPGRGLAANPWPPLRAAASSGCRTERSRSRPMASLGPARLAGLQQAPAPRPDPSRTSAWRRRSASRLSRSICSACSRSCQAASASSLPQVPFAALDEAANHLLSNSNEFLCPCAADWHSSAVRFFESPVFERLLRLSQCQPREAEHGYLFSRREDLGCGPPSRNCSRIQPGDGRLAAPVGHPK